MDDSRFDAIARLAGQRNRRAALRLLAASGLGVTVLHSIREDADAKCVNPDKKCKKKNGKKRKCCGGAKCQGKRCRCQENTLACGAFCCQPGQICTGEGNATACQNGSLTPGDACDPSLPLACSTGNCGCNGNLCACRDANCKAPGAACAGSLECCQKVCLGGFCVV